ncbi:MAG TPA: aromatic amino acid lyase, partial [Bacteroidia bacterium]|nr:aromatic amino acid lyase [Bacteroidia bacterium]
MIFSLNPKKHISVSDIEKILANHSKLEFSADAIKNIKTSRAYLDKKQATQKEPIYGVNTGFGSLCNVIIPNNELQQLQENLVKSHACGMGDEVPKDVVKIMLLLKIRNFIYGKSAVSMETANRFLFFYN